MTRISNNARAKQFTVHAIVIDLNHLHFSVRKTAQQSIAVSAGGYIQNSRHTVQFDGLPDATMLQQAQHAARAGEHSYHPVGLIIIYVGKELLGAVSKASHIIGTHRDHADNGISAQVRSHVFAISVMVVHVVAAYH